MSSTVEDAVAVLAAAVDGLLDCRLDAVTGPELVEVLQGLEVQRRRLDAVDVAVVAEVDQQRTAGEFGRTSTLDLLACALRVSPRQAKVRVDRARELGPRVAVSGESLGPVLPATSEALTGGEVSGAHASVIEAAMRRVDVLPDAVVIAPVAEAFLVDSARHEDPQALRRTAKLLLDRLDPDGVEPREDELEKLRGFTLGKVGDGTSVPRGRWTGELTAIWDAILDSLAAPKPAEDGAVDERTATQRRHDAMVEAGKRLLRSGTLPATGGTPVTVLVGTTAEDLAAHAAAADDVPADDVPDDATGDGVRFVDLTGPGALAQTERGDLVSVAGLICCGGDAAVAAIMLGRCGEVLNHGRTRRLASTAQRRALAVRDGGCCFPGCTRPVAWTEVHHVRTWLDGGDTDIDNLCLLCAHHHRQVDKTDWTLIMTDGIPEWLPPTWLDKQRRPVRNRAHHLPEISFDLTALAGRSDSG